MTEFHWFGVLIAAATILTSFGEISARKGWISLFNARKGVHVTVALCCALAIELIPINNWFIGTVGAIVVLLLFSVSKKWFSIDHAYNRTSWGIFYFGLSYFLLLIFWGQKSPVTVVLAMAVMGLADAMAALVGRSFPIPALKMGNEDKSWAGSSAFFIISSILLLGALHQLNWLNYPMAMLVLFGFVLWLTLIENSSANGTDNLSVPLVFGVLFPFLFGPLSRIEVASRFLEILPFVTLFGLLSFRSKSLSSSGTITAISLGVLLYSLGGWIFVIPILAFFISGSVLSRLLQTNEQVLEKAGARDPLQVIANGGAPLLALLFGIFSHNIDWAIIGFLGSVASATSDTWSTEWGMRFGGTPRHILNLSPIEKGLSGLLEPDIKETVLGSAEIQKVFKVSDAGKIAGSKVINGEIKNKSKARLIRDGVVVYTGEISSIFREKNAVKEVKNGLECGISLKDFIDFKERDIIESFEAESIERTI